MSKYMQNDGQMWGGYDFVDHTHEARTNQPSMRRAVVRGDYDVSRMRHARAAGPDPSPFYGRRRSFGADLPGMPDLGAVAYPVINSNLQYMDPTAARILVMALTNTTLQSTRAVGSAVFGTVAPVLGGSSWLQDEIDVGGAVLVDLAAARTFQFATTADPAKVVELAHAGGPFAIVAIATGLEAQAKQAATPVAAPPPVVVQQPPPSTSIVQATPPPRVIQPSIPSAVPGPGGSGASWTTIFANVPTWLKAAMGIGGVVLLGGALYGLAKPARGGAAA